ncbi:unnamed protein product [Cyprideis torosa]|uniref:alkaline phosphatase n=1 Tax=Cyprideis torosa TaxID=163714 RepID=A0A7R8WD77_9CRUS|nr:unnamed protein product [Cyprideis torosa]CAG0889124.1 unnamed protein product [Cyprideis torosa]
MKLCVLLFAVLLTCAHARSAPSPNLSDDKHLHERPPPPLTKRPRINSEELESEYWISSAQEELQLALDVTNNLNRNVAKNVILFLGDGMGIPTLTAARILKGQRQDPPTPGEEGRLVFETFPHLALSKTYNVDYQTPDSAGTGTAYLCGVKTNIGVLGVNARVVESSTSSKTSVASWLPPVPPRGQYTNGSRRTPEGPHTCYGTIRSSQPPDSVLLLLLSLVPLYTYRYRSSLSPVGIVTTTSVTHATPAAGYARSASRYFEDDSDLPTECLGKQLSIARQLVDEFPGNQLKVVLGGGLSHFTSHGNLTAVWQNRTGGILAFNNEDLLNAQDTSRPLLGLFSSSHMPNHENLNPAETPSIKEMALAAVRFLKDNDEGFALLVEGGKIDINHHYGNPYHALRETLAFDEAIEAVIGEISFEDTLVVVTADHSHTMTLNGYQPRGTPIHGLVGYDIRNVAYTSLSYANGPGYRFSVDENNQVSRPNVTEEEAGQYAG